MSWPNPPRWRRRDAAGEGPCAEESAASTLLASRHTQTERSHFNSDQILMKRSLNLLKCYEIFIASINLHDVHWISVELTCVLPEARICKGFKQHSHVRQLKHRQPSVQAPEIRRDQVLVDPIRTLDWENGASNPLSAKSPTCKGAKDVAEVRLTTFIQREKDVFFSTW